MAWPELPGCRNSHGVFSFINRYGSHQQVSIYIYTWILLSLFTLCFSYSVFLILTIADVHCELPGVSVGFVAGLPATEVTSSLLDSDLHTRAEISSI